MDVTVFVTLIYLTSFLKVNGAIVWDGGCGTTKGCFPDCTGGYPYLVTWEDDGSSSIKFTLQAVESDSSVYLAVGFSDDYLMGGDSVVACVVPSAVAYSYYNEDTNTIELSPSTLGLTNANVSQSDGVVSCSFTRSYTAKDSRFFDLRNDYILMLAIGEVSQKHGVTKISKHYMIPWSSDGKVDFNRHYCVGEYKLNGPVVKLHGIMMILAWLLFCVVGMLTARYNKDMLPDRKLLGTKIWFQVHRGVMISALVCVLVAFIAIFVHIGAFSQVPPRKTISGGDAHPVLGIIVTALCIINPIMALFRPNPDHKFRWIFNWAHFGVGVIALILAVVTVILGLLLERSNLPRSALWVVVAHIVVTVIAYCVLEVHKHMKEQARKRSVTNSSLNIPMEEKVAKDKKGSESTIPFISLLFCTVSCLAFCIAVLVIIALS